MLIDAAAAEDNAAIGFPDLFRQTLNIVDRNVCDPRRPFRRVTLFVQEITPPLPALDPVLAIALIVQILRENMLREGQAERHVRAGPNAVPAVRLARRGAEARVDHNHLGTVLDPPVIDHAEIDGPGFGLVVADIEIHPGAADILVRIAVAAAIGALCHLIGDVLSGRTERVGGLEIGGPPHLSEHPDIAADGDHARARASEDAKRFGLVLPQRFQLGGDFVERLLPADRLELPFAARANPSTYVMSKEGTLGVADAAEPPACSLPKLPAALFAARVDGPTEAAFCAALAVFDQVAPS